MSTNRTSLLFASTVLFSLTVAPSYAQVFTDVAATAGVAVLHDGASLTTDMGMGAGGAWFDYDNDGDLDLYMTMRTGANKLFRNNGAGTFTEVAASAGVADAGHDGSGVVAFDYNNDGCKDLYLANSNADVLFKNDCDGTFTDITAGSGLAASGSRRGTSASVGDYDEDGFLDLYVAHHMPVDGYGVVDDKTRDQDYIFHNDGDGTWTDVSVMLLGDAREDASFIAAWTDYDQDGDLDIYLIRDCGFDDTGAMSLWRNDGGTNAVSNWTFTDVAASTGSNFCQNGMGVAVGDYNRNGTMDLFYTDNGSAGGSGFPERAGTVLLKNSGGSFVDETVAAGVSSLNFSWGANFFDYDLDGWLDLFMAGGALNVGSDVSTELWHNNGNGTSFANVTATSGVIDLTRSRAGYYGDYDADGDPDLFLFNYGATSRLFRNNNANGNNHFIVDLQGVASNRDGVGARIALTAGGVTQHYETRSGSSLGGGDDTAAYFGLGTESTVTSMTVTWPSGTVQTLTNLAANQRMTVVESSDPPASTLFTDVAASAGVSLTHTELLGDMGIGTGAAWFDYDNDGDQDLYMTMRTGANRLFRNNGNGAFTDVAAAAGVGDSAHDGSGVAVADFNNDGCKDLYLANGDDDVLFRNNCDGTFTNVTAGSGLGASEERRGTSASWGDYNKDGFVDLYVAHHMPIDGNTFTGDAEQDYLFHNDGDGTFTDVSAMLLGANRIGRSFIAGWTDYDRDGDLDLYTIRDCPFGVNSGPMRLYRNDGGTNGVSNWTFTETSASANADWCQNGMGLAVGDYNRDGWMDFFYTDNGNLTTEYPKSRDGTILLKNTGGAFVDETDVAGVSSRNFSWGANFFDYDLDGWQDLFMAGGSLNAADGEEDIALWRNNANGVSFADVTGTSGMNDLSRSRTPVYADYDEDGDPDMFLVNYFGQTRLFKNNTSNGNNWLIVDLVGTTSNRDGIGAKLTATTPNGAVRHFETRSGSSLGGGDDLGAYFGLGTSGLVSNLTITWPSGAVQTLTNVAVNQRLTVTETGGGNIPPTASFTTTVIDLTVDVNASASSDSDGSIVSYAWTFGDGATGTGQTASHAYVAFGTYTITLTVTDNLGATGSTTRSVTLTDGTGGTGAFLEAGGIVTMEAENFAANIPRGDHSWATNTANAGFSGASAMLSTPDTGAQITVDVPNTSPELAFDVNFSTTGDYYMWGRVWAPGSNGDRAHFGFDGAIPANSNGIISKTVYNSWQWVDMIGSGTRQTVDVATTGLHEVNVWMREDGLLFDKIVLTTDAAFTPTGTGPAESPRDGSGGNPAPIASFTASTTGLAVNVDGSASTDDGSIVSYAWTFGDGGTGTGATASHTYAVAGTYSVTLTVTDDEGATGSVSQNVTVTSGGGGTGSFIESGGMVVMEAENFHANISRSSHDWALSTANAGFSGAGSMASTPDDGTMIKNSVTTTSPEIAFDVAFSTTGSFYLWGRIWAPDSKDKTVHIGINGAIPSNVNGLVTTTYGAWVWVDLIKTGLRQTFSVATAGEHTINVWMREDGLLIDKIVMTTDANFTPTGTGPAESPRAAASVAAKKAGVDAPVLQLMAARDLPTEFALEGNYPNPFNPTTAIRFALPEAASVRLEVYDAMGRRVATLLDNTLEAGRHEAMWDGRTDGGITVASGVYLYRIEAGSFTAVKSMLLVK